MHSLDRPMRILEGPAGERQDEAAPAFQLDAMRSVRLHPKLAAWVAGVVLVWTVGYAMTREPMYEARSLSYVEPLVTKLVSDGSQGFYDPARYDSYFQQQIQTATRQDILEAAISKMPEGVWQQPNEDLHHAAARLANTLRVERVGSSYQLAISVMSDNPEKASAIVNAATNAYLEQGRKDENARSDGRLVLLQEESQRIQKELQQDREEQATLNQSLGVADTQISTANPYDMQLAGVRTELVAARQAHDVAAAQLETVTGRGGATTPGLKAIADEAISSDSGLNALKTTINEKRAVLNAQMATLTPNNPVYKQDADEIAAMDRQVEGRASQVRQTAERRVEDRLRLELQRTGDVEARLNGELAHATAQAGSATPKLQRAQELAADIMRLTARYATVDDALRGLQLESNGPGTAHLLIAAQVPDAPAANHRLLLLVLALPLAAFAGTFAAVIARKRDKRLYSAMDLEQAVGVTPMCVLPASYEYSQDEHLLRLAAGLERGHRLNGARMFVFTPASESMDTSGVIYGVQSKLTELGFKAVVLAAEDVRQTTAAERRLGQGASQMEQLKRENAFLLIDARPLLHSADTEYVANCADATLVIVECGLTTGVELKRCMLLLQQMKVTGVGTVLLNASDVAGEVPARRTHRAEESRQRVPMWERSRGVIASELSVVPKSRDEEKTNFEMPSVKVAEELPKRTQSVPVAAAVKPKQTAYQEEPFMLFEEAGFAAPILKPDVQEKAVKIDPAINMKEIEQLASVQASDVAQRAMAEQQTEAMLDERAEKKTEQLKREAVARVKARYGMPEDAVQALSAVMASPMPKSQPAFFPTARGENISVPMPVVNDKAIKPIIASPSVQVLAEEEIFEWHEHQLVQQPTMTAMQPKPVAAQPVVKQHPVAALADLPPVRRITVQQERRKPGSPAIPWAPRIERRREPIAFPRGLNKAALRMQERGQSIAKGQAGPSLTAAEQAIVNKISTTNQPVAAKPAAPRQEIPVEMAEEQGGRWSLLRQFGGFEINEQSLQERAAG